MKCLVCSRHGKPLKRLKQAKLFEKPILVNCIKKHDNTTAYYPFPVELCIDIIRLEPL